MLRSTCSTWHTCKQCGSPLVPQHVTFVSTKREALRCPLILTETNKYYMCDYLFDRCVYLLLPVYIFWMKKGSNSLEICTVRRINSVLECNLFASPGTLISYMAGNSLIMSTMKSSDTFCRCCRTSTVPSTRSASWYLTPHSLQKDSTSLWHLARLWRGIIGKR